LSSEDFSCSYESSSRSSKAAKAPVKGKKNNIFHIYKASVVWCFFYYILARSLFQTLFFRSTNTASPQICPAIHFNLLSRLSKGFSLLSAILQPLTFENPYTLLHQNIIISLTNHLIKFTTLHYA
jgi:hypothetical protein